MAWSGPTGLAAVDRLDSLSEPTLVDYVRAVSQYVRRSSTWPSGRPFSDGAKKAAQIRMSAGLGRVLRADLLTRLPHLEALTGETEVSGALRTVNSDVTEFHALDGLRLAVEIKPINLAVGRAVWNRFGDIRTFAVNLHLKFPFVVVGGVLAIPTWEQVTRKGVTVKKDTTHLIERAISRFVRAGGRRTEGEAPHLLEAIAVVVYDPDTATLRDDIPDPASGLRWNQFIEQLADAYLGRFE